MHTTKDILRVKQLKTKLKKGSNIIHIVKDLSFSLKKAKTLALVGESGSGKSVTALSILGLLSSPPFMQPEGEVLYEGKNLLTLSDAKLRKIRGNRLAMIFQNPMTCLNPVSSIGDQLLEVTHTHLGLYGKEAEDCIMQQLKIIGIPSPLQCVRNYPHQLSGGMKQRIMIAMAIMCRPDILIADEPTTALDVTVQAQILHLLKELQDKYHTSILLITHDLGVVAELAHDVMVMYAGRAIEQGSVQTLFDNYKHPYTKGLFLSRPTLSTPKGSLKTIKGQVPAADTLPQGCPFHPRCPKKFSPCAEFSPPWIQENKHGTRCWLYEKGLD